MEEDNRGKLIKITFEYENEISTLNGEQAQKWNETVDSMCVFMQWPISKNGQLKYMNPIGHKEFNWERTPK